MPIEMFHLITNRSEFIGTGNPIPGNSRNPKFVVDSIKSYYFNKDSIYVFCIDEEKKTHWIVPFLDKGWVVFDEIKNVKMESLSTYKCVEIMGTGN